MSLPKRLMITAMILAVAACVTINVYFPEAAAERAVNEFVSSVNGTASGDAPPVEGGETSSLLKSQKHFDPLMFLVPAAYAQQNIDININTGPIRAIQDRMRTRQQNELKPFFEAGAVGYGNDALVHVKDRSAVGLADRNKLDRIVAAENQDRAAVYREIAVANGHPEWEDDIRRLFASEWVQQAEPGWYYQNQSGDWLQK